MSRRVQAVTGGHMHRAWESQPLIGPQPRARRYRGTVVLLAFAIGLALGVLI